MKRTLLLIVASITLLICQNTSAREQPKKEVLHCAAFSPYVGQFNPNYGPRPPKQLIDTLLDNLVKKTPFRCIMTYGVMDGLEYTFEAAKARHLKVIAIIWLDNDTTVNSRSITAGIKAARAYPDTIVKLSCGSEVRTRNGYSFDGEISRCINAMREARVPQPVTTIDIWWEWCNRAYPCQQTIFGNQVDWIGINVFPWWDNEYSGLFPCTSAQQAADFHIARIEDVRKAYPGKDVVLTEFGWPNGPEGAANANKRTGQQCSVAGKNNQELVVKSTFKKLAEKGWSGNVFAAYSENWKPNAEGDFGRYWGICQGEPPYDCMKFQPRKH
ncbi:MAG: exo-beta-1,3-glucanase [Methylobacter sp.]